MGLSDASAVQKSAAGQCNSTPRTHLLHHRLHLLEVEQRLCEHQAAHINAGLGNAHQLRSKRARPDVLLQIGVDDVAAVDRAPQRQACQVARRQQRLTDEHVALPLCLCCAVWEHAAPCNVSK